MLGGFSFQEEWHLIPLLLALFGILITGLPEVEFLIFNSHNGILHNFMDDKTLEKNRDTIQSAQKWFSGSLFIGCVIYMLYKVFT